MMRRNRALLPLLVVFLAAALASGTLDAKAKKKSKPGATSDIPSRPEQLTYGPLEFAVPDARSYRHELTNGIPVYVGEDHDLPLVNVSIRLRAGAFLDPADKTGLASMTGSMLRRGGTQRLSAEEFDERVDFLASNIGSFGGSLTAGASFNSISDNLAPTLDLFFEMLKTPGFDAARLQVEKENQLESMKQRNDNPASISGREWQWLVYGQDHFAARSMTQANLVALTRDDLIAFHRKYWRPDNMMIAVSGDVDTQAILKQLEAHFAGWSVEGPTVPWPPPVPQHEPRPGVYYVQKEIPQGRVTIGHLGIQRENWDDPEPFVLMVMNDILGGGGFTSRLVQRIRSDEGLAYSAGSGYGVGQYWPGVFRMSYQSKSETVAYAAKIALEEMRRISTDKVSEEELRVAKNSIIDAFPRRFESASQIVDTFVDDEYDGRPHSYWGSYRDRVRAVGADDVLRVAAKHLHPDRLVFLIVGDWDDIVKGDADGKATMAEFHGGRATELPLRDPLTLEPLP